MELFKSCKWQRWVAMVGACLIQLTLGNFYTLGNLNPYVISYLRNKVNPTVDESMSIWINALSFTSIGLPMFFGGYMEKKLGTRITCIIGGIIFCGSIALSYYAIQHSFLALMFTYGFSSSAGISISYVTTVALAMKWFPKNISLASGTVLSFFGLGPLIINPLQTALINPHNLKLDNATGYFSDEELLNATPCAFLYIGLLYACIHIFSICILFPPNQDTDIKHQENVVTVKVIPMDSINKGRITKDENATTAPKVDNGERLSLKQVTLVDISPIKMLTHKEFYMLWITFALLIQTAQFINSFYKVYDQKYTDDHFLTSLGSGAAVCNFVGRIFWGLLMDKTSYKTCMLIICTLSSVLIFTFFLTGPVGRVLFAIWVLILFFIIPGIMSLIPVATAKAFGPTYASINFGIVFTAPALMSLCGAPLISYLLRVLSWLETCCILGGFNVIAFLITLFMPLDLDTIRRRGSKI